MTRVDSRAALLVCVACFAYAPGRGICAQSSVRTVVDTTLVTVGDRIEVMVTVDAPSNAQVVWPDSLDLSPFEVVSARALPPQAAGDRTQTSIVLSLTAFELGELEIPSFDVTVMASNGSREVIPTDRYGVEVVSVGADDTGDIRDIRGPVSIAVSVIRLVLWGLLLVALVVAALWALRRWRASRRGEQAAKPGPPPRPAHELALEALQRVESSPMLERGQVKEYHIEVSDILRRYVEARFRVPALEMTTGEVLGGLAKTGVGAEFRSGLQRLLDQCDMVKFAKVRPSVAASHDILILGRTLIEGSIAAKIEADPEFSEADPEFEAGAGEVTPVAEAGA